jgi:AcrR family transcriptional regulator
MVEAAVRLFGSAGYAGTTMEAVAAESGMSVQSVYFAFHSKAGLLQAAFDLAAAADDASELPSNADELLRYLVGQACDRLVAIGPLVLAAAAAGPGDQQAAEIRGEQERRRAQACADLVQTLRKARPLRAGVTARSAADVVFALVSPHVHALLTDARGWSQRRYVGWVSEAVAAELWG